MRVIQTTEVRLGASLDPDVPITGEVRLLVLVDETGKLVDLLLAGSSHRLFTNAAVTALQEWRFEPAHQTGKPVGTRSSLRLQFESRGRVVSISGADVMAALAGSSLTARYDDRIASPAELDAPVQAITTVQPRFPAQLSGQLPGRTSVIVDFYVDETGQPRMPVAVRSPFPLLSVVALDAIDQWRFAPPTRKGLPVVVHVQQEFVFFEKEQVAEEGAALPSSI